MSVVTLTFIKSEEEISSGIPERVTIESNIPATIFFTIDGSTPTTDSPIYISSVEFPTGVNSVILKAFGIDSSNEIGPTLIQTYAPDLTQIDIARFIGSEGLVVDRAGLGEDIPTGFDADNQPARFIDADPSEYEFLVSDSDHQGIGEGLLIRVKPIREETNPSFKDDNFEPFSTPEKAEFFNPTARTILIDNRLENDVKIIPRPYGSLHNIYQEFGGKRLREPEATYVSGGFVKRFYDARNKVMVGYYFDHNEGRYVKNIQELPNNIPGFGGGLWTVPLVFKWLGRDGRQSSIL